MSNVYVLEPPTHGKVLLKTTYGDIDIELWAKEAPKAVRNFVQLCMEGYYDNVIFNRVVKNFMVQTGDPTGSGYGGESIYDGPFKDEFHQRLRFTHRGIVAMANSGPDDNQSQFFITLNATEDLNRKHTIFGKVVGDTIFNVLRIGEVEIDDDERPLDPPRIKRAEVIINPFDDIVPRVVREDAERRRDKKERKVESSMKKTKDFKLLSFGDDAEEDEAETERVSQSLKIKSSHAVLDDPRLSKEVAVDLPKEEGKKDKDKKGFSGRDMALKASRAQNQPPAAREAPPRDDLDIVDEDALQEADYDQLMRERAKRKFEDMANGADKPKKETVKEAQERLMKDIMESRRREKGHKEAAKTAEKEREAKEQDTEPDYGAEFLQRQKDKYAAGAGKKAKADLAKKAEAALLAFQSKLTKVEGGGDKDDEGDEEEEKGTRWMANRLEFEATTVLSKDPFALKAEEMYDLIDPRNPLTKMRREEAARSKRDKDRERNRDEDGRPGDQDRDRRRDGDRDRDSQRGRGGDRDRGRDRDSQRGRGGGDRYRDKNMERDMQDRFQKQYRR